ncbi:hypothetical protein TNCV_604141 [Trichonephila clavipes]|nr:hypothetical protein TNCV_604141 [Trichonephila clavipes]
MRKSFANIVKLILLHYKAFGRIPWIEVHRKDRTSERRIYTSGPINTLADQDVYIRRWNFRGSRRIVDLASKHSITEFNTVLRIARIESLRSTALKPIFLLLKHTNQQQINLQENVLRVIGRKQ